CRSMGLTVAVPDVNESLAEFAPRLVADEATSIRFGLASVRNVGENIVEKIVGERNAAGPFTDVYDFCRRVDQVVLNKRALESLIKAGAFDSLGHPRQGLSLVVDGIVDRTLERRHEHEIGVQSLFASLADTGGEANWEGTVVEIPELDYEKRERLAFEKEMLGMYVSDHPISGVEGALRRMTDLSLAEVNLLSEAAGTGDSQIVNIGGIIGSLTRRQTKAGDMMATILLLLERDELLIAKVRIDLSGDRMKVSALDLSRPTITDLNKAPLRISLPPGIGSLPMVEKLKQVLTTHPGTSTVFFHIGAQVIKLPEEYNVDVVRAAGELRMLLGPEGLIG
ncbi:MAG: DNA polymerase III subunit alpha, partial [Actinobacteria bacterium]|nr:DNA polymerase III subunit alpha [Actinomycetota bacterium]